MQGSSTAQGGRGGGLWVICMPRDLKNESLFRALGAIIRSLGRFSESLKAENCPADVHTFSDAILGFEVSVGKVNFQ